MILHSAKALWRDQRIRFLAVGVFNTASSVVVSFVVYFLLARAIHIDARLIAVIATGFCYVINITIAYIGYKFIVFQTRGNYLREYLRFYVVYAIPALCGLVLIPAMMTVLQRYLSQRYTFYVAQPILTAITLAVSYYGHKTVTFRQPADRTTSPTRV